MSNLATPASNAEKALEILRLTNDGDLLSPSALKLTEDAINGFLNAAGQAAFDALHAAITLPEFTHTNSERELLYVAISDDGMMLYDVETAPSGFECDTLLTETDFCHNEAVMDYVEDPEYSDDHVYKCEDHQPRLILGLDIDGMTI